jgi:hypothetical protein
MIVERLVLKVAFGAVMDDRPIESRDLPRVGLSDSTRISQAVNRAVDAGHGPLGNWPRHRANNDDNSA